MTETTQKLERADKCQRSKERNNRRREERRNAANARCSLRAKRSPKQQLAELDSRPGWAKRERGRIVI